jgi:hypothetical protein
VAAVGAPQDARNLLVQKLGQASLKINIIESPGCHKCKKSTLDAQMFGKHTLCRDCGTECLTTLAAKAKHTVTFIQGLPSLEKTYRTTPRG